MLQRGNVYVLKHWLSLSFTLTFIYGTNKAASEESLRMKWSGVLLLLIEEDSCFRQSGQRDEMTVGSKDASAYSILSEL